MRVAATAVTITAAALALPAVALAGTAGTGTWSSGTQRSSSSHVATRSTTARLGSGSTVQLPGATGTTTTSSTTTSTTTSTTPTPTRVLRLAPRRALNLASGRTALGAYAAYLDALVKAMPTSQARIDAFVTASSSSCRSALAPLTQGGEQIKATVQSTLTALGQELGDDLALSFDAAALPPLSTMSQTLEHLRWTRGGRNGQIIRRYLNAQMSAMLFAPSSLCQDALMAAATPRVTPAPTRAFLRRYAHLAQVANVRSGEFMQLLQAYVTNPDQKLVARIGTLATELTRIGKAEQSAGAQMLSSALEGS